MAELTPWLVQKFYETDGVTPANGHKIFTYEAGTTTKKDTKSTENGSDNTNPIITNSDGTVDGLWLEAGPYKIVQAPANDTDPPTSAIKTWDRVNQSDADGNSGIVDTVAALKALTEGEFEVVQMLGHDAVGDKASGLYRWDATSALADDGIDVIEPSTSPSTGRWIRIFIDDYKPANLTELRALPEGSLNYVYLGGHTTDGDGGGGWFRWDSANTDSDNDGTVILPSGYVGSGRWVRLVYEEINIKAFGATGDGTTDDQAACNACAAWALANDKGIFAPAGTYYCTSPFILGVTNAQSASGLRGVKSLRGEGTDLTVFKFSGSGNNCFDYAGARYFNLLRLTIEGVILDGDSNVVVAPGVGLLLSRVDRETGGNDNAASVSESWISDIEIRGYFTDAAYYNYAAEETHMERVTFENRETTANATIVITDTNVDNITSSNATLPGTNTWRKQSCIGHYFDGCRIFDYTASLATDYGVVFYGATSVHITNMSNYTMFNGITASRLFQIDQDTTQYTEVSDTGGQPTDIIFDGVFYHETTDETTVYINCTVAGISHVNCRGGGTTGIVCASGIDIAGNIGSGERNVLECIAFDGSASDVDVLAYTVVYPSASFSISDFFIGEVHIPDGGATITITDPTRFYGQIYNTGGNTGAISLPSIRSIAGEGILTISPSSGNTSFDLTDANYSITNSTVNTTAPYRGFKNSHTKTAGASGEEDDFFGIENLVEVNQTGGTVGFLYGIYSDATLTDGSSGDDVEDLVGASIRAIIAGGTVSDDMFGQRIVADLDGGTVTDDVYGLQIVADIEAAVSSIGGNVYGLYVQVDDDKGAVGTVYGVYIDDLTGVDWAIFQLGTAPSLINGDIHLGSGGPKVMTGSGTPEGAATAPVGSTFHRTDGGAGTSFYVKESGSGNTGWVGK